MGRHEDERTKVEDRLTSAHSGMIQVARCYRGTSPNFRTEGHVRQFTARNPASGTHDPSFPKVGCQFYSGLTSPATHIPSA